MSLGKVSVINQETEMNPVMKSACDEFSLVQLREKSREREDAASEHESRVD